MTNLYLLLFLILLPKLYSLELKYKLYLLLCVMYYLFNGFFSLIKILFIFVILFNVNMVSNLINKYELISSMHNLSTEQKTMISMCESTKYEHNMFHTLKNNKFINEMYKQYIIENDLFDNIFNYTKKYKISNNKYNLIKEYVFNWYKFYKDLYVLHTMIESTELIMKSLNTNITEIMQMKPELMQMNPELMQMNPELMRMNPELMRMNAELMRMNTKGLDINLDELQNSIMSMRDEVKRLNNGTIYEMDE